MVLGRITYSEFVSRSITGMGTPARVVISAGTSRPPCTFPGVVRTPILRGDSADRNLGWGSFSAFGFCSERDSKFADPLDESCELRCCVIH